MPIAAPPTKEVNPFTINGKKQYYGSVHSTINSSPGRQEETILAVRIPTLKVLLCG
jgi:hypothetical protein